MCFMKHYFYYFMNFLLKFILKYSKGMDIMQINVDNVKSLDLDK